VIVVDPVALDIRFFGERDLDFQTLILICANAFMLSGEDVVHLPRDELGINLNILFNIEVVAHFTNVEEAVALQRHRVYFLLIVKRLEGTANHAEVTSAKLEFLSFFKGGNEL